MSTTIRVGILTVSDTAPWDQNADRSGPTIKALLNEPIYSSKVSAIVPDDLLRIRATILTWVNDGDVDWIITTGGTGFGVRDCTPEAVKPILDREASGLIHLMLSNSLTYTPLAALSRPVAGTIGSVLVVTLPGSVKAVKENMQVLLRDGLISHAIELIRGGSGKELHAAMASGSAVSGAIGTKVQDHSHHHHHHHGHGGEHQVPRPRTAVTGDPLAPVSARARKSPFPIIPFGQATELILTKVGPLPTETLPVTPALGGYALAQDVYATQDVPSTFTTNVDGYALRSSYASGTYQVLTPGMHSITDPLPPGTIYRVNTGGPLPAGADAVIMVEDTRLVSTYKNQDGADEEEKEVETLAQVPQGENIRKPGSDVRKGDLALQTGDRLSINGGEIGTLAFVGCKEVKVYKKPVVAILSTGNEIVDLQNPKALSGSEWGGIFDTNRPSLQAALEGMGYKVVDLGVVPDKVDAHVDAIRRGLEAADLLLGTGGTSMGSTDLLKPVIERHFNGTIHFGRVAVKPGKPTTFATVPYKGVEKPVFALPGNPASALVTFHIFVLPALRRLSGFAEHLCQLPRVSVKLTSDMPLDPRVEFHRVVLKAGQDGLKAYSTGGQRSSRVASLSGANGFVVLPAKAADSPTHLRAGDIADAVIIGEIQMDI